MDVSYLKVQENYHSSKDAFVQDIMHQTTLLCELGVQGGSDVPIHVILGFELRHRLNSRILSFGGLFTHQLCNIGTQKI